MQTCRAQQNIQKLMRVGHLQTCLTSLTLLLVVLLWPASWGWAASVPSGFTDTMVATGLSNPTAMEFSPDGRLFVAEQGGRLRVIKNGTLLSTSFLTVTVSASGERGLLGITFDPDFSTNQYLYVFYTATSPTTHNRVSRFKANGDVADTTEGEVVLLDFDNLSSATNHNGGAMHFGPDGKLYVAHGENATGSNSQSFTNLLGKLIRMNPVPDATAQIPTDNPFFSSASGKNRLIWSLGLRNPFTFDVQPGSGLIYVNDVGQNTWEEINDARAGLNFGWPTTEGTFSSSSFPQFTNPAYTYGHSSTSNPSGCAIIGSAFYNPSTATFSSSYVGKYFFAEYCSGWIRYLDPSNPSTITQFATGIATPVDLKVGPDGALYYLARGSIGGHVGKIQTTSTGNTPQIVQQPTGQTVPIGGRATFTVNATGATPLSYQWQKNTVDIPGATATSYTTPPTVQADNGTLFRCVVTNAAGIAISNAATLSITPNTQPTAAIVTPAPGMKYSAGTILSFSGAGTDTEDGPLPASAFKWRIDFHHDAHTHPGMPDTTGITSGSFAIPNSGETAATVWYRVYLTVTDSGGLSTTTQIDVTPNTSVFTLATAPAGLRVTLDGQPVTTPVNITSVVGLMRTLAVVSPQTSGSNTYDFVSWSNGGAATHSLPTAVSNASYTATYRLLPDTTPPTAPQNLRIQ